jgi:hypothetical protein
MHWGEACIEGASRRGLRRTRGSENATLKRSAVAQTGFTLMLNTTPTLPPNDTTRFPTTTTSSCSPLFPLPPNPSRPPPSLSSSCTNSDERPHRSGKRRKRLRLVGAWGKRCVYKIGDFVLEGIQQDR